MIFKLLVWIGVFIGALIGGYIATLFGVGAFSLNSIIISVMGGVIGIWAGYEIHQLLS